MDQMRDGGVAGRAARSFPGGQVRLPRLNEDRTKGPQIDMVDTAFIGGGTATVLQEAPSGFTGYYTYESLFDEPAEGDDDFRGESPYDVLRVTPTASWSEIVFSFTPTPGILISALVFAGFMGLCGGFFPALQAARISPVRAMRE